MRLLRRLGIGLGVLVLPVAGTAGDEQLAAPDPMPAVRLRERAHEPKRATARAERKRSPPVPPRRSRSAGPQTDPRW